MSLSTGKPAQRRVTELLRAIDEGGEGAQDELLELVYADLRRYAGALMQGQRKSHTLQATALVGESYLRLFRRRPTRWKDKRHFLLAAAKAMRHVLLDHARGKNARKRVDPTMKVGLDELLVEIEDRSFNLIALEDALTRLEKIDPEMAHAVNLRFYLGAKVEEVARIVGMSSRTFERRWALTRAWLYREVL